MLMGQELHTHLPYLRRGLYLEAGERDERERREEKGKDGQIGCKQKARKNTKIVA